MKNHELFEAIALYVGEKSGFDADAINRNSLVEDDLGVSGEDAAELIRGFGQKFNVDITDFIFANYFNDEPSVWTDERVVRPFTIGHLERAAIEGRLDDEIISRSI